MDAYEFVAMLRGAAARMRAMDNREGLEAVAKEVHASVGRNYVRQVDENGTPWPPRKDNKPHPLLMLTLAMSEAGTGGPGAIVRIQPGELKMGIEKGAVTYYPVHHTGSSAKNIPKRRVFYLHPDDRPRAVRAFGDATRQPFREQVLGIR